MNYLAHLFLSGENAEVKAGNLFGDEVKGKDYENFPESIKVGLLLHRFIDSYTDVHEKNLETKKILYPELGKYAGIALDIYYDHFLAKNWSYYSDYELDEYALNVYNSLEEHSLKFSEKSQNLLQLMKQYDWLQNYARLDGMKRTFEGMAKRLGKTSGMKYGYVLLEKHYATIEASFGDYFPDLLMNANNKLLVLQSNQNK